MRLIVEVTSHDQLRAYRLTVPDDARITWQGANPTKQYVGDEQVLRIYQGKKQLMAIPNVLTWRVEDLIQVEEFVQVRNTIGNAWVPRGDAPVNYHPEDPQEPTPVDEGLTGSMRAVAGAAKKRRAF